MYLLSTSPGCRNKPFHDLTLLHPYCLKASPRANERSSKRRSPHPVAVSQARQGPRRALAFPRPRLTLASGHPPSTSRTSIFANAPPVSPHSPHSPDPPNSPTATRSHLPSFQ